ncbi:MAG: hypothetical protein E7497_02905 [Ruminococcus sp.]|nr:hypothetical protein [Ruminococcus sp.]
MQNKGLIFFHRGLHGSGVPENSIPSFENAIAAGIGIELDVRLSRDGVPVVFHDKTLKRMCGDKRKVSELTVSELKKLRLSGTDETIPTFEELLSVVRGRVPLMIETKPPKHRLFDRRLERSMLPLLKDYKGTYYLQSFDKNSMKYLDRRLDGILCGILSGNFYAEPVGFDFINYKLSELTPEKVSQLRRNYSRVLAWSTGESDLEKSMAAMEILKLDGIVA